MGGMLGMAAMNGAASELSSQHAVAAGGAAASEEKSEEKVAAAQEPGAKSSEKAEEKVAAAQAPGAKSSGIMGWAKGLMSSKEEGANIAAAGDTLSSGQREETTRNGWTLVTNMDAAASLSASNDPGKGLEGISAPVPTPAMGQVRQVAQNQSAGWERQLNG